MDKMTNHGICRTSIAPGAVALLALALSLPTPAAAYVGPGAGLTVIGSLVAVIAAVLIALMGLVLFPLRLLMKKMRAGKASKTDPIGDKA